MATLSVPRRGLKARIFGALALLFSANATADGPTSIALWYAAKPPFAALAEFDWVVVEPGHLQPSDVQRLRTSGSQPFAYLSVGEFAGDADTLARAGLSDAASSHRNSAWASQVMDLTSPRWREHLLSRAQEYRAQGYRGLFLDTLDSFQLQPVAQREAQRLALVGWLQTLHQRFPDLKLIFNRGFEVLPELTGVADAIAVESIHAGWDAGTRHYRAVPANDREWLLGKLAPYKHQGLALIAIEYLPPEQADTARALARQLCNEGFVPFITTPQLDHVGISTGRSHASPTCP